jgi:predicted O-methyltransferase YrrM
MSKRWYQPSPHNHLPDVPWLAPDVITHLENLIQPDWEIVEHGSGGSTVWFASRCKSVTAFESNAEWQKVVSASLPDNAKVLGTGGFAQKLQCDLLLIDGEPVETRADWLRLAPDVVKPGGWVVLDNANRPEYAVERKHLQAYAAEFETFDRNEGGTMYLVTEFYRLPDVEGIHIPYAEDKRKKKKKGSK